MRRIIPARGRRPRCRNQIGFNGPRNFSFCGLPGSGGISTSGALAVGHRQARQQVGDQLQAAGLLVVEVDQRPRRGLGVRGLQHAVARAAVVVVLGARLQVDRRQLPLLERIVLAVGEALLLLGLVDGEPVLEQPDAVVDQHLLEDRRRFRKASVCAGVQ